MKLFKKKKSKIPKGIRNIRSFCYIVIIASFFIYWLVLSPPIQIETLRTFQLIFKSLDILNPLFIPLSIIWIMGLIIVLIGFKKRKEIFWKITWIFFLIVSLSNLISGAIQFTKDPYFFNFLMYLFYVLLGSSFAWYIYKRKDYYIKPVLDKEFPEDRSEKNFNRIIWIVIILLIVGMQGQKIYELHLMIKAANTLGKNRFYTETAIEICKQQKGNFRDFCLLILIDIHRLDYHGYNKNFSLTVDYCEEIKNPRWYDRCQIKFLNCEKVKNELQKDICIKAVEQIRNK